MLTSSVRCAGDWLSIAAALPAPAPGALWGGSGLGRPGTSLYASGSAETPSASPVPESRFASQSHYNYSGSWSCPRQTEPDINLNPAYVQPSCLVCLNFGEVWLECHAYAAKCKGRNVKMCGCQWQGALCGRTACCPAAGRNTGSSAVPGSFSGAQLGHGPLGAGGHCSRRAQSLEHRPWRAAASGSAAGQQRSRSSGAASSKQRPWPGSGASEATSYRSSTLRPGSSWPGALLPRRRRRRWRQPTAGPPAVFPPPATSGARRACGGPQQHRMPSRSPTGRRPVQYRSSAQPE
jgi:hypothetical protein